MGRLKTSIIYLPRPACKYPGCYPLYFERRLPELMEADKYIQVFSGMAETGFRVDIRPEVNPDLVADAHALPLENDLFDAGMADPPYTPEFAKKLYGVEYPRWGEWTKELVRVVKPGGRIGIMQNYIVPRMVDCILEEIVVVLLRIKQFPKIITMQRKLSGAAAAVGQVPATPEAI